MWRLAGNVARRRPSFAASRLAGLPEAATPLAAASPACSRWLAAPQQRSASSEPGGGMPNPLQILGQLQEQAHRLGQQAGLPAGPEDIQGKLVELKAAIEDKMQAGVPVSEVNNLLEKNSEKLQQVLLPYVAAGAIIVRSRGPLGAEQEEKLREVLPEAAVNALQGLLPAIPEDPQVELSKAILARLDSMQAELVALKAEVKVAAAAANEAAAAASSTASASSPGSASKSP
eukprot:TRINITY_DN125447_c0_g1_i1.p1 TRINITY_DN125447_c0_g1~~TRINITY_DN125447_c0_g1_i1.p1  ORF type:complete len:231 (+),score=78.25 TRINITY_DN125447_c0_g1_i1:75-767(+)